MDDQTPKIPTLDEIRGYLTEYGWNFRDTKTQYGIDLLLTNYALDEERGILISLRVEGEFVMVTTVGLLAGLGNDKAERILWFQDTMKLVKLFAVANEGSKTLVDIEIGFELWDGAWTKETFFAFMDMLCLGIEKFMREVKVGQYGGETKFVQYQKPVGSAVGQPSQ